MEQSIDPVIGLGAYSNLVSALYRQADVSDEAILKNFIGVLRTQRASQSVATSTEATVEAVSDPSALVLEDVLLLVAQAISRIDQLLEAQINEILHHPGFQAIESAWLSLYDLVEYAGGRKGVKLRLLDISWSEITKDVNRAVEFDQSQLFHKIYSQEFDTPGGEPYGVLIANFDVAHKPYGTHRFNDIPTLERLTEIASAAFAPIILNGAPELFGLDGSFDYLAQPIDLRSIFQSKDYLTWNRLRSHSDARFMGITVPRVLLRPPYATRYSATGGFLFREKSALSSKNRTLWGGANFAFAKVLIREFSEVGWFSHIRGVPRDQMSGGLVSDSVVDSFQLGVIADYKPSVDVLIADDRERELSDMGFIPLCQCYDLPFQAFHSTPSIYKNRDFTDKHVRADERVASSLQHVLCGARFAHYIKVMIRDKIGSYTRAQDCGSMIQRWLDAYTVSQEDADWQMQARFPLRKALVSVSEIPDKPGAYWADIQLQPHYQADSLVSELHLTTELSGGGRQLT